ncbi:MAG: argininosuccinate lyase [Verrucomicrobia bacterium]|nr:argininosuccinate lyase [Verrucomicrobiota bacterium]
MAGQKTLVGKIHPDVLAFTAGKDVILDGALVEADCIGSAAHVRMLSKLKLEKPLFSETECDAVIGELVAIMRRARAGRFPIRPDDQDVHLAVERALSSKLGDAGKRVHTARSRNDQVALDLRLYAKEQLFGMIEEAAGLARLLLTLGQRHARVPMVGRTHLQPAMPSSVGVWASAHAESLLDDVEVLLGAYAQNDRSPLGSAAGYGVPLAIDRALTSRLLGFERPIHNVMYASMARGKCESVVLAAASQVMLSLSRLAEDMILFMMPEFGYFRLSPEYCTGSSIMPQKQNPDVFELVRARTAKVLACTNTIAGILKGLPGGYQRDLQETKEPFLEGVGVTRDALRAVALVMGHVEVDAPALKRGFNPGVFATDRALELVASGVPFRDAYNEVKAGLDQLGDVDPVVAIAAKVHEGAPAGLDFSGLKKRASDGIRFVRTRRKRYYSALSKLLGVPYPELGK